MTATLRHKAVSGLFWTFSQQFSTQIVNFVVQIILARILMPADFGLIAILSVFIGIGTSIMDSGLTLSLIRTEKPDNTDFSTVFFMNLIGSVIVYLVIFLSAPTIATFFDQPQLVGVLRVYAITLVIRAFSQVQQTRLTKEMNFRLQLIIQLPSIIIGGVAGILMAYYGMGVWSLVWMALIQGLVSTIQFWVWGKWIPSFVMDLAKLKLHFNFGYKLALSGLLNTAFIHLYDLVIGKYFTAAQLGYYNRANTLRMFPVRNLSTALNRVTYPLFSSIQNDDGRLRNAYQKVIQQVLFLLAPTMVLLIVLAEPLFLLVLTEKWLPAVPYFQLLCISGIFHPISAYNLNILNVKGRSDLFLRLELIKKGITVIGIIAVIPFGIYGLVWFQVVNSLFALYINAYYSGKMIGYGIGRQVRDTLPILILAVLCGIGVWVGIRFSAASLVSNDFLTILVAGLIYFSIYLGVSLLFKLAPLVELSKLLKQYVRPSTS